MHCDLLFVWIMFVYGHYSHSGLDQPRLGHLSLREGYNVARPETLMSLAYITDDTSQCIQAVYLAFNVLNIISVAQVWQDIEV